MHSSQDFAKDARSQAIDPRDAELLRQLNELEIEEEPESFLDRLPNTIAISCAVAIVLTVSFGVAIGLRYLCV